MQLSVRLLGSGHLEIGGIFLARVQLLVKRLSVALWY